jgi:hypothetical protein
MNVAIFLANPLDAKKNESPAVAGLSRQNEGNQFSSQMGLYPMGT